MLSSKAATGAVSSHWLLPGPLQAQEAQVRPRAGCSHPGEAKTRQQAVPQGAHLPPSAAHPHLHHAATSAALCGLSVPTITTVLGPGTLCNPTAKLQGLGRTSAPAFISVAP